MIFASPVPWWAAFLIAAAILAFAVWSYRRPLVPLSLLQRAGLTALRVVSLGALFLFLCRPTLLLPPATSGDLVVPVLVDVSRSMRIPDENGRPRIARALEVVQTLLPLLSQQAKPELYAVGDGLSPTSVDRIAADGRRSDLSGSIAEVRDRFRGRRIPAVVLISDGVDTGGPARAIGRAGVPVVTVGVGTPDGLRDREVTDITAADPHLDQASAEIHVSAATSGYGRAPFEMRLLANGRLLERRRIVPTAERAPIDEFFNAPTDPLNPTVFTAEIGTEPGELVTENNSRSVLVSPAGRRRRILALEGALGYDH